VFVGRRRNKVKCLLWDRTGFWCLYKRIERGRLPEPHTLAREGITMGELSAWLEGIDTSRVRKLATVNALRVS
jgi:transposase